jgi:hypothetical protein
VTGEVSHPEATCSGWKWFWMFRDLPGMKENKKEPVLYRPSFKKLRTDDHKSDRHHLFLPLTIQYIFARRLLIAHPI